MRVPLLETDDPNVRLVEPDIERDAELGVGWLEGDIGRNTLRLMGIPDNDNNPTTIEQEQQRVAGFIERPDQLNWMIEYEGRVVGSIWVDLEQKDSVASPSIHIMIGDPNVRGKGLGYSSANRIIQFLQEQGNTTVYSRHLLENVGSEKLLERLEFKKNGVPYTDVDGLRWQNVEKSLA